MKKSSNLFAVIFCFALNAASAHAGEEQCSPPILNKPGATSEMQGASMRKMGQGNGTTHLDQRFNAADTNHDNGLDKEESKAMPVMAAYFDKIDVNHNGKVTREEYFDAMPMLHQAKGIYPCGQK